MARPPIPSGKPCYHCGSLETSKAGMTKQGKQRFYCRGGCRRFFCENPQVRGGRTDYRKKAGPDLPSVGQLILELHAVAQKAGRTPTTTMIIEMSKAGQTHSLNTYYAVFGSFLEAVKRAKLKPRYKQEFDEADRERMLGELSRLRKRLKRPIYNEDVNAARRKGLVSSPYHFKLAFGSVPAAIEAAGAAKKIFIREEMIAILRSLDAKLDRPIQKTDIQALYDAGEGPSVKMFLKEFKTLSKARRAAGTKTVYRKAKERTTYWQKYTKEELIAQLKALGKKLGRRPTDRDINTASKLGECASATTFASMFGSLPKAYRAAGFDKVKPRSYKDEEIVSALKRLSKSFGRMPTFHEIQRASSEGKCPSPGTIVRRIGKLTDLKSKFER